METCAFCGQKGPTVEVSYKQNTGMLFMRRSRQWVGRACRTCSSSIFWKSSLHTFFLGWWGMISLFLTPVYLIGNMASMARTLSLPKPPAQLSPPA